MTKTRTISREENYKNDDIFAEFRFYVKDFGGVRIFLHPAYLLGLAQFGNECADLFKIFETNFRDGELNACISAALLGLLWIPCGFVMFFVILLAKGYDALPYTLASSFFLVVELGISHYVLKAVLKALGWYFMVISLGILFLDLELLIPPPEHEE
jgi:hypothetical protein